MYTTVSAHIRRLFEIVEDVLQLLVAALLIGIGGFLVVDTMTSTVQGLQARQPPITLALTVLDKTLVLFIVAELLHMVRITFRSGVLDAEPFLVVGLIAGIRRVLILTAESERSFQWNPQGIELTVLIALILVVALAILVYRLSARRAEPPNRAGLPPDA